MIIKEAEINTTMPEARAHKKRSKFQISSSLIVSVFLFIVGLILILNNNKTITNYSVALTSITIFIILIYTFFVNYKIQSKFIKYTLVGIIFIGLGFYGYFFPNIVANLFRIIVGGLGIVLSGFMFLNMLKNKKGIIKYTCLGIIYGIISLVLLFSPYSMRFFSILLGIYFIFISISLVIEIVKTLNSRYKYIEDNFLIGLPTFVAAFLPIILYRDLNAIIKNNPKEIVDLQTKEGNKDSELTIYIQTRAGVIPGLGHCSLEFDGKVYSYGDYDRETGKLFGFFSDGVLAIADPDKYLKSELKNNKKMILAYQLKLSPEQKEAVKEKIDSLLKDTVKWETNAELFFEKDYNDTNKLLNDPGSLFYLQEDANLFKFNDENPFRTYCGLTCNCTHFVNDIVKVTGLEIIKFNSIISPGSYLSYLDHLYNMKNSIIVGRKLYSFNVDGKPIVYPKKANGNFSQDNQNIKVV